MSDAFEAVYMGVAHALCPENQPLQLPSEFQDLGDRARWAHKADPPVLEYGSLDAFLASLDAAVRHLDAVAAQALPTWHPFLRLNTLIRLWCGCTAAAKTMRAVDRDRKPVPREHRQEAFARGIDPMCRIDAIYEAGVEAAPTMAKTVRNQEYWTEGVPADSPALRFLV